MISALSSVTHSNILPFNLIKHIHAFYVGVEDLIIRTAANFLCGICAEEFSVPWGCRRHILKKHMKMPYTEYGLSLIREYGFDH